MKNRREILKLVAAAPLATAAASPTAQPIERSEWARYFSDADAVGSILVADERAGLVSIAAYGLDRSRRRHTPASTFKIPHSLFALDAGLVKDEFQIILWDRVKRPTEAWNTDQTLRSAMRKKVSCSVHEMARSPSTQKGASPVACALP